MADSNRSVTVTRSPDDSYTAHNIRGGALTIGDGAGAGFTPTELLLAAIGACTAIDVGTLTARRAEPDAFEVRVDAEKVRDEGGNHLQDLVVTFRVAFPDGPAGDAARELLPEAVRRSHDRLCTVSRTVELGTPVAARVVG
jgi:putative redox protein